VVVVGALALGYGLGFGPIAVLRLVEGSC
jgi:hypothetical protein